MKRDLYTDFVMIRRIYCLCLVVLFLSVPALAFAAQPQSASAASLLKTAMMGVGPLPGASVLGPMEFEDFDDLVRDHAWVMPESQQWPMNELDEPIVETRQKDEKWHTLDSWHSVATLRSLYRRNTSQLRELNPDIELSNLEEGDKVRVWKRDEENFTESRGEPQSGRLVYGEPMPESDDYIVLFPHRSFGTYYAISETVRVLDEYYEVFPGADPLIVGDASFRTGRRISPHSSHQSGRDIDVTLPRLDPPPNYNRFHHVRRDNLDTARTLWLLTNLLEGGYVEHIFLDWHHQRSLWNLAKEQGAPEEWLDEVFQYPRRTRTGLIRHEPGHATHFHVRFACQETDRWCR